MSQTSSVAATEDDRSTAVGLHVDMSVRRSQFDVTVAFDGGSYVLKGAGKKPIQLTLAAQQAQLGIDGTVKGSLTTAGYQGTFTVDSTTGSATLRSGVEQQKLTMEQVASVLAPNGGAALACSKTKLIMLFDSIRLELER